MSAKAILSASVSAPPAVYVEDVFSTFLYTGNGSTQTITNGIDLAGEGGLVWLKNRGLNPSNNFLFDTLRGAGNYLSSNQDSAEGNLSPLFSSFNANGFGLNGASSDLNSSSYTYASWTFRKQPKFFDVVTYTGNGTAPRNITHSLGSSPGFIVIKRTDSTGDWQAWHRSIANKNIYLNHPDAASSGTNPMISAVSSANFTLATNQNATMNINNATYVAYLFAHDAGGFGTAGTDNVVSCGSFSSDGSGNATVSLGYEPQWLLMKRTDSSSGGTWFCFDVMRGWSQIQSFVLNPNDNGAETTYSNNPSYITPTSTGFQLNTGLFQPSATYIYIAIRRGPMKTPTVGTEVFNSIARTGTGTTASVEPGFVTDLIIDERRSAGGDGGVVWDRLRGAEKYLFARTTGAEGTTSNSLTSFAKMNGVTVGADSGQVTNVSGQFWINWMFRRAPGFFDVVAYTGTGASQYIAHNLGVDPELIICKKRSGATSWGVQMQLATLPFNGTYTFERGAMSLNSTAASTLSDSGFTNTTVFNSYYVTDTTATYGTQNASSATYIAYLFATAPGVSKVGNYTGTGTTKQIDCGFTAGARFVLIKRTDSTGDWYVWDTARGIISGNDPSLLLNSTAAEVTGTDYIDPLSSGFEISSTAPAAINANGGTYIFLAIA